MNMQQKSIAVMQPYVFPYIGYFQLINAVDIFVFYDDVNFIKQGWINRNQIYGANNSVMFTIPLIKASSFKQINETEINNNLYKKWKKKFYKSLEQTYSKAPYFSSVAAIVEKVLNHEKNKYISDLAILSIAEVMKYLEMPFNYVLSSKEFHKSKKLEKAERLYVINKKLNSTQYINAIGGQDLYDKKDFAENDIQLNFLKPSIKEYEQFGNDFVPGLSIIDVLMFNSKDEVKQMMNQYELI